MLSYSAHNLKTVLVKGDKKKFAPLLKQVEGRWNTKQDGWLIPVENEKKLKNLITALYPDDSPKEEVVVSVDLKMKHDETAAKAQGSDSDKEKTKMKHDETAAKAQGSDSDSDESKHKDTLRHREQDSRRYRRSRSPPSSHSSSSSTSDDDKSPPRRKDKKESGKKIDKYYQSFKKSPRSFNSNLYDDNHVHLSSSSSSDYDSSSPDFPNPSPKRNRHVSDDVLDKMEAVRRRLRQMEMEDKDRRKR